MENELDQYHYIVIIRRDNNVYGEGRGLYIDGFLEIAPEDTQGLELLYHSSSMDKLFNKKTSLETEKEFDPKGICSQVSFMRLRARMNSCDMFHFKTPIKVTCELLEVYINYISSEDLKKAKFV